MRTPFPKRGLYAITAEADAKSGRLLESVRAVLRGGAAVVQLRAKSTDSTVKAMAIELLRECRQAKVPLIINDDVELAFEIGADGVHLGRDDMAPPLARARLGADAIIGVSCYDSVDRAVAAAEQGADYVAFGRFFPSSTKPNAPCASLDTLRAAKRLISAPLVAIGGVTPDNGSTLIDAGSDLLAVVDALFGATDPEAAARRFQPLFNG